VFERMCMYTCEKERLSESVSKKSLRERKSESDESERE